MTSGPARVVGSQAGPRPIWPGVDRFRPSESGHSEASEGRSARSGANTARSSEGRGGPRRDGPGGRGVVDYELLPAQLRVRGPSPGHVDDASAARIDRLSTALVTRHGRGNPPPEPSPLRFVVIEDESSSASLPPEQHQLQPGGNGVDDHDVRIGGATALGAAEPAAEPHRLNGQAERAGRRAGTSSARTVRRGWRPTRGRPDLGRQASTVTPVAPPGQGLLCHSGWKEGPWRNDRHPRRCRAVGWTGPRGVSGRPPSGRRSASSRPCLQPHQGGGHGMRRCAADRAWSSFRPGPHRSDHRHVDAVPSRSGREVAHIGRDDAHAAGQRFLNNHGEPRSGAQQQDVSLLVDPWHRFGGKTGHELVLEGQHRVLAAGPAHRPRGEPRCFSGLSSPTVPREAFRSHGAVGVEPAW